MKSIQVRLAIVTSLTLLISLLGSGSLHAQDTGLVSIFDGTIKAVDAKKRTITVQTETKTLELDVSRKAKVSVKGKTAKLDSLKTGQKVTISYHDGLEIVLKIEATVDNDGFVSLFDGKTLKGWKANENKETWKFEDGNLVCHGPRSHLFYVGDKKPFVNFEFKAEVMTTPGSNAGIYFHTRYQETGWPKFGYEAQVNITHKDPKKTGSLYGVVNVSNPPAKDNEWWTQHIIVKGKQIEIKINDKTVVNYTEPEKKDATSAQFERRLASGTFALQGHDPKSKVYFRNLRVKRLP